MSVSASQRGMLAKKFERLVKARTDAEEAYFVAIYEAMEAGASHRDIAHMVGDKSGSGIPAKAAKGRAILEARKARR